MTAQQTPAWWAPMTKRLRQAGQRVGTAHVDQLKAEGRLGTAATVPDTAQMLLGAVHQRDYDLLAFWAPEPVALRDSRGWGRQYYRARADCMRINAADIPGWGQIDRHSRESLIDAFVEGLSDGFYDRLAEFAEGFDPAQQPSSGREAGFLGVALGRTELDFAQSAD